MELREGKACHLCTPRGYDYAKVHIDKIMGNPTNELPENRLVVYRYWRKRRQRWEWDCDELWVLQMHNEILDLKIVENEKFEQKTNHPEYIG